MDCSPPSSSVHGISQAGILQWVAISFSKTSSRSGISQNDFLSLPPARSMRGLFSAVYHKNLVKLLEVKFTKVWVSLGFYISDLFMLTFQQFISYQSGFHTRSHRDFCSWVYTPVSCTFLCIYVVFSSLRGSAFPCNLTSLMNLSAVGFSVWLAFYFLECSGDFQLLSCQTGNWKLCDICIF